MQLPGVHYVFPLQSRERMETLPEPFRSAIGMSNGWAEQTGVPWVKDCLTIILPEIVNQDGYVVMRISYDIGFEISKLYGCPT